MTTIPEIAELLKHADKQEFLAIERSLADDARKGVATLLKQARARIEQEEREARRLSSLYDFDAMALANRLGTSRDGQRDAAGILVGLDEVGRGAVAGPLAVGAVVLSSDEPIAGLNDSKQLTPLQREEIAECVKERALAWAVQYVEPAFIDRNGMSQALRTAFAGALGQIEAQGVVPDVVLVDGNPLNLDPREVNVVKGDAKSASIAAASIIAKVTRDALMCELSSTYPQYGFQDNKGYASEDHRQAIREQGLSPVHRASFCKGFMQESLF